MWDLAGSSLLISMSGDIPHAYMHNLPLARHAANECGGWVKIVKRFRLSHKPMGLASIERMTV